MGLLANLRFPLSVPFGARVVPKRETSAAGGLKRTTSRNVGACVPSSGRLRQGADSSRRALRSGEIPQGHCTRARRSETAARRRRRAVSGAASGFGIASILDSWCQERLKRSRIAYWCPTSNRSRPLRRAKTLKFSASTRAELLCGLPVPGQSTIAVPKVGIG